MSEASAAHVLELIAKSGCGQICRCRRCGGLHWKFGNLSACLTTESLLHLANLVEYAETTIASKLIGDERVVIPFTAGNISLLLDRAELGDLHSLVHDGLKWLDEPQETAGVYVH